MILNILFTALILFIYMNIAFLIGTIKKNNAVIDSFYGAGFVIVAWTSLLLSGTLVIRQIIVTILVTIWGIRLSTYVTIRNWGKSEDYRYKAMRERFGDKVLIKSYGKIYMFQGLIIFLVVFPVIFINATSSALIVCFLDWRFISLILGVTVWILGFYFEFIGDYQLNKFLKNPNRTKNVLDEGLWKYTQHPNYFGEVTMWWGLFIVATGVPWGLLTVFGPILINFMIIKVSGVRLLNKRYEGNPEYIDYKRRTSAFIPWFPKKKLGEV